VVRLPRGKALQRNLDTTYVRFDGVLQSLHREGHTGYVRIVSTDAEAILFIRDGELIAPVLEHGGKTLRGMEALVELLEWLTKNRAFLDICRVDYDMLRALLAFHHGTCRILKTDKVPADRAALAALFLERKLTGAALIDAPDAPCQVYAADGVIVGTWWPDTDRWTTEEEAWAPGAERCEIWECPDADTLRTVDLDLQRVELHETLRRSVEGFVPGFGDYLFDLEVRRQDLADPRHLGKGEFYRFADGLRARCRLLIGARRAGELGTIMRTAVGRLIDVGI
jgi:hypothetical protein